MLLKRRGILLFILICVCFCLAKILPAATLCDQSFILFAFSRASSAQLGQGTFLIGEDIGGECYQSYLIWISITDDHVSSSWNRVSYGEWGWLKEALKYLPKEEPKELVEKEGVWYYSTAFFRVTPPPPDTTLLNSFDSSRYDGSEAKWIGNHDSGGVSMPIFEDVKCELIYYHIGGLYIGYRFSKVYYFPHSKYLLIFTHQPRLATGLDTMHGFLLFKTQK
jgi:hypothetical protein